ncbi:MAG: ABC transporter ATP-binding protein [Phocaeicola sp.]
MKISIEQLKKCYGPKVALHIDSCTLPAGQIIGLVGNNGAGKTTLFRLLLDLLKADQGTISINEWNVAKTEEWKQSTGAFIDESFLIEYLTPEEYFAFVGKMYGLTPSEIESRLQRFERFTAGEVMEQNKYIRNFSAGNKQKIGIMAAMLSHPKLLILDEPFNFLDPSSQAIIKKLLVQYNQETEATILISSHNLNHTVDICPRIVLLEQGEIIRNLENQAGSAESELEEYFRLQAQ